MVFLPSSCKYMHLKINYFPYVNTYCKNYHCFEIIISCVIFVHYWWRRQTTSFVSLSHSSKFSSNGAIRYSMFDEIRFFFATLIDMEQPIFLWSSIIQRDTFLHRFSRIIYSGSLSKFIIQILFKENTRTFFCKYLRNQSFSLQNNPLNSNAPVSWSYNRVNWEIVLDHILLMSTIRICAASIYIYIYWPAEAAQIQRCFHLHKKQL